LRTLGANLTHFYAFVGRYWVDCVALLGSSATLAAGVYLASTSSPVWLNRAGSLIVIIGVILAASRFHQWLEHWTSTFFERNYDSVFKDVAAEIGKQQGDPLSPEFRDALRSGVKERVQKRLVAKFEADRTRFKLYELYLIVGGTFLNGFGDYLVCLFKTCSS
jgi:hypothetical protein